MPIPKNMHAQLNEISKSLVDLLERNFFSLIMKNEKEFPVFVLKNPDDTKTARNKSFFQN